MKSYNNIAKYICAIGLCLLAGINLIAQINEVSINETDTVLSNKLQNKLNQLCQDNSAIGLSVAINIPFKGHWTGIYGYHNKEKNMPLTNDMIFGFGSITKTFLASLFLQYVEEGKITLNDTIGKWIDNYNYVSNSITISQLLNHTSGLYEITDDASYKIKLILNPTKIWTADALLIENMKEPYNEPGLGYHYSNTNYLILSMIAEKISNKSLTTEIQERFIDKYSLNNTFFADSNTFINNDFVADNPKYIIANLYMDIFDNQVNILWEDKHDYMALWTAAWGAGSILSNTIDILKWVNLLYSNKVLSDASMSKMLDFTPQSDYYYGLGCENKSFFNNTIYGHSGYIAYQSVAGRIIDDGIDFVFASNDGRNTTFNISDIANDLIVYLYDNINSINDNKINQNNSMISVYPNIVNNYADICINSDIIINQNYSEINIIDTYGKTIKKYNNITDNKQLAINAEQYPNGIYFIILKTNNKIYTNSFIINK